MNEKQTKNTWSTKAKKPHIQQRPAIPNNVKAESNVAPVTKTRTLPNNQISELPVQNNIRSVEEPAAARSPLSAAGYSNAAVNM